MPDVHVDVSEHQTSAFTDAYTRRFGMFRAASEYDRPDAKAAANLAWCLKARGAGRLVNFGVYVIPGNVPNDAVMGRLDALKVPADCVIMLDAESWGGLITGDHSAQFNTLADTIRARQGGRADLVWGYLNPNVDAGLWPHRPAWLGFIQPAFGPATPPDPRGLNRIGWQYCNAVQNGTAYPSSSAPFGRCDHNVMYIDYPKPGDDPMALVFDTVDDFKAAVRAVLDEGTGAGLHTWAETSQSDHARLGDLFNQANAQTATLKAALQSAETEIENAVQGIVSAGGDPAAVAKAVIGLLAAKVSAA